MDRFRKTSTWLIMIVLLVSSGSAVYFYSQYAKYKPRTTARQEAAALIDAVGRLIVLPVGEQPTIATVSDPARLKSQPFFADAKAGDKVLIYAVAKKAILYSPEEDKIIEVAPLDLSNTGAKTAPKK